MSIYNVSLKNLEQQLKEKTTSLGKQLYQKRIAPLKIYLSQVLPQLDAFIFSYRHDLEEKNNITYLNMTIDKINYVVNVAGKPQLALPVIEDFSEKLQHLKSCLDTFEQHVDQTITLDLLRGFYLDENKLLTPPQAVFLIPNPQITGTYDKLIFTKTQTPPDIWQTRLLGPSEFHETLDALGKNYLNLYLVSNSQGYPLIDTIAYILLEKCELPRVSPAGSTRGVTC